MIVSKPLLLHSVEFFYDEQKIFGPLKFEFQPGTIYILQGASGQGKTTLLQCLSGHLMPQNGEIALGSQKIFKPSRQIFYVNQDGDLFDWLTVQQHFEFCTKLGAEEPLADHWLHHSGLFEHREKYPFQLSMGQRKRLAIARAFLMNPQVILLDETLSSLDPKLRSEMLKEVEHWVCKDQRIAIIVSHYPEEMTGRPYQSIQLNSGLLLPIK